MYKNFKNIDKVVYGRGSFDQLDAILEEKRSENDRFMVFIVDEYFKGKDLEERIPVKEEDLIFFENKEVSPRV
jgi:3-deoxy-alpha-D-manno-octulosonate 8-oxidase